MNERQPLTSAHSDGHGGSSSGSGMLTSRACFCFSLGVTALAFSVIPFSEFKNPANFSLSTLMYITGGFNTVSFLFMFLAFLLVESYKKLFVFGFALSALGTALTNFSYATNGIGPLEQPLWVLISQGSLLTLNFLVFVFAARKYSNHRGIPCLCIGLGSTSASRAVLAYYFASISDISDEQIFFIDDTNYKAANGVSGGFQLLAYITIAIAGFVFRKGNSNAAAFFSFSSLALTFLASTPVLFQGTQGIVSPFTDTETSTIVASLFGVLSCVSALLAAAMFLLGQNVPATLFISGFGAYALCQTLVTSSELRNAPTEDLSKVSGFVALLSFLLYAVAGLRCLNDHRGILFSFDDNDYTNYNNYEVVA